MTAKLKIHLKRAYEAPDPTDGRRYLVERLWPRGISRDKAALDGWLKDISPSPDLRKWYHEDKDNRWDGFCERYRAELDSHVAELRKLRAEAAKTVVTFVYGASDHDHNSARLLRDYLETL
ncbi:DUF488 domain-containing protein [Govanella unica]|uniref:DUF488 family protein n=1 Tax=Govanella unica TaxID=2975056 RepID=A0A9X3TYD8_9PROT|nr:DUF488 family protein [Govania unica]MDA5194225.1 DUF488 family protein [Govania unica]